MCVITIAVGIYYLLTCCAGTEKRAHLLADTHYANLCNCTATISTAQDNRTSFLTIHPCLNDMRPTLPALSFKRHKSLFSHPVSLSLFPQPFSFPYGAIVS